MYEQTLYLYHLYRYTYQFVVHTGELDSFLNYKFSCSALCMYLFNCNTYHCRKLITPTIFVSILDNWTQIEFRVPCTNMML